MGRHPRRSRIREVERVLKVCNNNSRPGYVGCALESAGLVTRCFNYPMVDLVHTALAGIDPIAWEWRSRVPASQFSPEGRAPLCLIKLR
jgi:hypothetical protein